MPVGLSRSSLSLPLTAWRRKEPRIRSGRDPQHGEEAARERCVERKGIRSSRTPPRVWPSLSFPTSHLPRRVLFPSFIEPLQSASRVSEAGGATCARANKNEHPASVCLQTYSHNSSLGLKDSNRLPRDSYRIPRTNCPQSPATFQSSNDSKSLFTSLEARSWISEDTYVYIRGA